MQRTAVHSIHVYEVRPRKDHRGVDLISDALRFGAPWYAGPNAINNAIGFAKFYSRSHHAVIRVYDETGNVIEKRAGSKRGERSRLGFRADKKAATMPPPMSNSHPWWIRSLN